MTSRAKIEELFVQYTFPGDHAGSNYFALIKKIVKAQRSNEKEWVQALDSAYKLVRDEIITNCNEPLQEITFGTSGWRGELGKEIYARSVATVTTAILQIYEKVERDKELTQLLGVRSFTEAQSRGCVLGFDNRFGGDLLASYVMNVLCDAGFVVHYAGESTTGVLSAAVLELNAAFSINLTPSHNPLEYGGYKFNAADGGPAESAITSMITANARKLITAGFDPHFKEYLSSNNFSAHSVLKFDSLDKWKQLVKKNQKMHGLDIDRSVQAFEQNNNIVLVVDCVHGASRLHIKDLFSQSSDTKLIVLRSEKDVTFGGVSPEPSSANLQGVVQLLKQRKEKYKIGAIIDPDGDRIRFTDGNVEISMNQFGAMAYHFLHEKKGKKGMVAKTVATSNLANSICEGVGEKLFEPAVGFKNFKSVIGKALVYFEESDGISIIGHTPEKDAYIGLLLALEMVLHTKMNLGEYLNEIEKDYGYFYPKRDGIKVKIHGDKLLRLLNGLDKYVIGSKVKIGDRLRIIKELITIDGRKMIFDDGSWLMIRPSGTEPKVRFYVESRSLEGADDLVDAAQAMLIEIGLEL